MKRLFWFPVSSGYLEKDPGVNWLASKIPRQQLKDLERGGGDGSRTGGWRESESSGNIYFPYQFLHGESSNIRTHTTSLGSTTKFKARITRISEIFYRTRPKDAETVETVIRVRTYNRDEIKEGEGLKS